MLVGAVGIVAIILVIGIPLFLLIRSDANKNIANSNMTTAGVKLPQSSPTPSNQDQGSSTSTGGSGSISSIPGGIPPMPGTNLSPGQPLGTPPPTGGITEVQIPQPESPAVKKDRAENKIANGNAVTLTDISGLSASDLRILRNAVFARHGRIFESSDLQSYFESKSWYKANPRYSDSDLSSIDRANVQLIQEQERNAK
jgi:hypothetical protein